MSTSENIKSFSGGAKMGRRLPKKSRWRTLIRKPKDWLVWGLLIVLLLAVLMTLCTGCESYVNDDGDKVYRLNPVVAGKVEKTAEGAIDILGILTPLIGAVAPIAMGGIGTGLAVWRKMKPKLVTAQTKQVMAHSAASAVVDGIDEFKRLHPKEWEKLREQLNDSIKGSGMDTAMIENFIRSLRGIPTKAEPELA